MTTPHKTANTLLLLLIIAVAAILRFWDFTNLQYMHDELSALARTQFNTVQDVITYGVKINDTHPPGVQLLEYYLTKFLGTNEMIVKFPFILGGIFSVVLAYLISKKWFNITVALITASFIAILQYMIMYSQLARPYSIGLFFCLLMVWCWTNFLFEEKHKNKWIIGYVLSAACCAYVHHFSLLFAVIVGLSGMFFLTKTNWKQYILSGVLIFVLYIPNLSILFFQLGKGGLGGADGWLAKPDSGWLYTYIKYVFHFSYWMYLLVLVLVVWSILYPTMELRRTNKYRILCIIWFFSMFFIEYFYSIYVSAIIQFSTLIFAFPFLLIFLFSLYRELNVRQNMALVLSVLITGTATLVLERKHFQVFYNQPFEQHIVTTAESMDKIKDPNDATVKIFVPFYLKDFLKKHYLEKQGLEFDERYYSTKANYPSPKAFRSFVFSRTTPYFIAGDLPLEYIQIIKQKYPYILNKEEGFTYSTYCFTREKSKQEIQEEVMFSQELVPNKNTIDSTQEYGQAFSFKLKEIVYSRHSILIISADLQPGDTLSNPLLVGSIEENGQPVEWKAGEYFNFNNDQHQPNKVFLCIPLTSFRFKEHPDVELKVYVWNKDKKPLRVSNMKLEVIKGNPLIYSLFEPLD